MTDRELLELAAKAAGIDGEWSDNEFWLNGTRTPDNDRTWLPLDRDGDALRLAVKLIKEYGFELKEHNDAACFESDGYGCIEVPWLATKGDYYAATRRAIVRAAAEIGKGMP